MTAPAPRFGALRHRNFRLIFFGQAVSLTGTWMQTVAQGWLVLTLTDSPFYVGLTSALGSLGVLLFTLYAGIVADRTDKRRALIVTQTLLMLQAVALALLVWTGAATIERVLGLAAFLGVVSAFDIPMRQAFVAELVDRDALVNAIALNSSVFNASRVVGPAIAGLIIAHARTRVVLLLECDQLPGRASQPRGHTHAAHDWHPSRPSPAGEGSARCWRTFAGIARVGALILLTAILSVFGFPLLPMMPVFARDVLRVGAAGYGALTAAMGIGALAGALAIARVQRPLPALPLPTRRRNRVRTARGPVRGQPVVRRRARATRPDGLCDDRQQHCACPSGSRHTAGVRTERGSGNDPGARRDRDRPCDTDSAAQCVHTCKSP